MKYYISMLINCPRCGFSQPKDQYCASCGVNIEKYVPQKTSLSKKIFSSTLSQVAVVIIVTLGTSYYALKTSDEVALQNSRRKNFQQIVSNSSFSKNTPNTPAEGTSEDPALNASQNRTTVSVELENENQQNRLAGEDPNTEAAATNQIQKNSPDSTSTLPVTTAAAAAAALPKLNIKVSYYEVNRTILAYWIQNSHTTTDSEASFNAGTINRKLFEDQIRYSPLKTESTTATVNVKTNFKSAANKEGIIIGLDSEILMNSLTSGSITLTKMTSLGSDQIRASINLSTDRIYFIHWKNDLVGLQNEPALAEIPPFQIFKSKQFMMANGTTELVMVIELLN